MKKPLYIFLQWSILVLILTACNKELAPVKETQIITDTVVVNTIDTIVTTPTPTTLFLVRHAEKQTGNNPSLTEAGTQRANELARFLEKVPLDAIYSSNYKRTQETAQPTATKKNISITTYDARELQQLASDLLATQSGKNILIVGHSNTTPDLVNLFTQTNNYPYLSEKDYDDIFLLQVHDLGTTDVLHFKYGKPSE